MATCHLAVSTIFAVKKFVHAATLAELATSCKPLIWQNKHELDASANLLQLFALFLSLIILDCSSTSKDLTALLLHCSCDIQLSKQILPSLFTFVHVLLFFLVSSRRPFWFLLRRTCWFLLLLLETGEQFWIAKRQEF